MGKDTYLKFHSSISFKLTLISIAFILIAILSISIFSYYEFWNILIKNTTSNIRARAKPIIENYLKKHNLKNISDNLARDLTSKNVVCTIIDKNGKVIANGKILPEEPSPLSPDNIYISKALSGVKEINYIKDKNLVILIPLKKDPFSKIVGVAQFCTPVKYIYSTLYKQGYFLLLISIITLILTGTACYIIISKRLKELKEMVNVCNSISDKNFSKRLNYSKLDEIGIVVKSFNKMLDKIENLINSQKRFVSNASHELRTPLTALKGSIEVLIKGAQKDKLLRERLLKNILNEINRLIILSERLLMLSQIEVIELKKEKINSKELFTYLNQKIKLWFNERRDIIINQGENKPFFADKSLLTQVFYDLIDNAIKFSKDKIVISWNFKEDFLIIVIRDYGCGIPEDKISKVFEPFYQENGKIKGYGLGLPIIKAIIDAHNGEIYIKNNSDKGISVIIKLPANN